MGDAMAKKKGRKYKEKYEDTKRLIKRRTKYRRCNGKEKKEIGNRKSKNRQCNGQMKTYKGTNNDPQITTQKPKYRAKLDTTQ